MKVHIAIWHSWTPDCPAVTSDTILGAYSTPEDAQACTERFMARLQELNYAEYPEDPTDASEQGYTSIEAVELNEVRKFYPTGAWPI